MKAEDPDISITEQAKKIGALWNELSAEEKEPYEKLAEEDKERYNNEMAQYSKKWSPPESRGLFPITCHMLILWH